jgi:hypothetical protein
MAGQPRQIGWVEGPFAGHPGAMVERYHPVGIRGAPWLVSPLAAGSAACGEMDPLHAGHLARWSRGRTHDVPTCDAMRSTTSQRRGRSR